jgi:hypothetical protein
MRQKEGHKRFTLFVGKKNRMSLHPRLSCRERERERERDFHERHSLMMTMNDYSAIDFLTNFSTLQNLPPFSSLFLTQY